MNLLIGLALLCVTWDGLLVRDGALPSLLRPGRAPRTPQQRTPQHRRVQHILRAMLLTAGLCSLAVVVSACNIHVGSGH